MCAYHTYRDDEGNKCLWIRRLPCPLDQYTDVQSLIAADGIGLPPDIELLVDLSRFEAKSDLWFGSRVDASLDDLPQLSQLTHLELAHSGLKLPTRMASCTSLTHLRLNGYTNPIPADFHVIFPKLTHLDISTCGYVVRLPDPISDMTSLTSLTLWLYRSKLSDDFHIIYPQLTHLAISKCRDDFRLPDPISGMTSLTSLTLNMYPHALPALHTLFLMLTDKLKTLIIVECENITIPSNVWNLLSLESLDLMKMNLDSIPDGVFNMTGLRSLDVSCNNIRIVPTDISHLNKLTALSIAYNPITKLPLEIADMDELTSIYVGVNEIMVKPPTEICGQGTRAIKEYLRNASDTELTCTVQIIGETESGKTSLCRTLIDGEPRLASADDRTKVLNTHVWDPEPDISIHINDFGGHGSYKLTTRFFLALRTLLILVFDILKGNDENFFNHYIGDWLDSFHCYLPTARIALVGTHCEEEGFNELKSKLEKTIHENLKTKSKRIKTAIKSRLKNLEQLKENCKRSGDKTSLTKYENEVKSLKHKLDNVGIDNIEIFWISSKTMFGISKLKAFLIKECRGMGLVEPKQWSTFYKRLTGLAKGNSDFKLYLPMPDVFKVFNEHQELHNNVQTTDQQNESLKVQLEFFHNVGKILLFNLQSSDGIDKIVLHNIDMLIRVMRECFPHDIQSILTYTDDRFSEIPKHRFEVMRKRFLSSGLMGLQLFRALIRDLGFTDDEFDILVKLFKSFHLCFDVSSNYDSHLLFPWFLSDARPEKLDSKWSRSYVDGIELGFDMQFSLNVPRNFFQHAQVILHQRTGVWNGDCLDWKSGAYAVKNECRLLLQRTTETNSVQLRVRGSSLVDCLDLMNGIRTALEEKVHDGWPGATYDIVIICPHCILLDRPTPHLFMANEGYTKDDTHLRCGEGDVGIPIGLIYPENKDATDMITIATRFLDGLRKERETSRGFTGMINTVKQFFKRKERRLHHRTSEGANDSRLCSGDGAERSSSGSTRIQHVAVRRETTRDGSNREDADKRLGSGDEAGSVSLESERIPATSGARPKDHRKGHLFKEQSTTEYASFVTSVNDTFPSIGIVQWSNGKQGTVFRVGTHYVITCYHVIDPPGGAITPKVRFDMDKQNDDPFRLPQDFETHKFSANPVAWFNRDLDAAVLELALPHGHPEHPVPPITKFVTFDPVVHKKVSIVGHPDGRAKLVDWSCEIKPFNRQWYNSKVTWSQAQFGSNHYDGSDDVTRVLYQASEDMKGGSSGGPGFVSVNDEAHLVLIHARGFPDGNRHACPDRTYTMEQGVKISDILNKIQLEDNALYDNIRRCDNVDME